MNPFPEWTVLIADDDDAMALLVQKYLSRYELQCKILETGAQVIKYCENFPSDTLLILDYFLPDMNGDKLLRLLGEKNIRIPFIVITGNNQVNIAIQMMKLGALDYVVKEIGFADLLSSMVLRALEQLDRERKLLLSEKARNLAEKKFQHLVDKSPVGIFINLDMRITYVNPKFSQITGYELKDLDSVHSFVELLLEQESSKKKHDLIEHIVINGFEGSSLFFKFRKKNREIIDIELYLALIQIEDNPAVIGFVMDVSERYEREREIMQKELRYRELVENTKNGVAVYEAVNGGEDFIFVEFNRGAEIMEGILRQELLGKSLREIFPGVKDFGILEALGRVYRTGNPEFMPVSLYQDERVEGWRENYIYKLPTGEVVALFTDRTIEKQAEEALRQSEEKFRSLFENSHDGIIISSPEGKIINANLAAAKMVGFDSPTFLIGTDAASHYYNSEDRKRIIGLIKTNSYIGNEEIVFKHKNGRPVYCLSSAVLKKDKNGKLEYIESSITNITQLKKAFEKIETQQQFLHEVIESLTHPFFVINLEDNRAVVINSAGQRWVDSGRSVCHCNIFGRQHPCEKRDKDCPIELVKKSGQPGSREKIFSAAKGKDEYYEIHFYPIFDKNRNVVQVIEYALNITERKIAQQALRESEERYRDIVENIPIMLMRFNSQGIISFVNREFTEFFSEKREKILGKNIDQVIPGEAGKKIKVSSSGLSEENPQKYFELWMENAGGQRWVQWIIQALFDEKGTMVEMQAAGKDATEQKEAEERIQFLSAKLLKAYDDERQRISQELHDGVGQVILAAKLNFKTYISNAKEYGANFQRGLQFIDQASNELREVYNNLYPSLLTELGLESAIHWLSEHLLNIKNIVCQMDLHLSVPPRHELAVHLFRIIQEAFTNIIKHSEASQAKVKLVQENNILSLEISDNGLGLKDRSERDYRTHFGLENMKYRAELLGGKFIIDSPKGQGTRIRVTIEEKKSSKSSS